MLAAVWQACHRSSADLEPFESQADAEAAASAALNAAATAAELQAAASSMGGPFPGNSGGRRERWAEGFVKMPFAPANADRSAPPVPRPIRPFASKMISERALDGGRGASGRGVGRAVHGGRRWWPS